MLDELLAWAEALKWLRNRDATPAEDGRRTGVA